MYQFLVLLILLLYFFRDYLWYLILYFRELLDLVTLCYLQYSILSSRKVLMTSKSIYKYYSGDRFQWIQNRQPCASQVVKQTVTGNDNISVEQILLVGRNIAKYEIRKHHHWFWLSRWIKYDNSLTSKLGKYEQTHRQSLEWGLFWKSPTNQVCHCYAISCYRQVR